MSTPMFPCAGVIIFSPSKIFRPESSSTSANAFSTPRVTSSNGASTVVGDSPRKVWRYTPSFFSIRMALVVVLPQSVAIITFNVMILFQCNGSPQRRLSACDAQAGKERKGPKKRQRLKCLLQVNPFKSPLKKGDSGGCVFSGLFPIFMRTSLQPPSPLY